MSKERFYITLKDDIKCFHRRHIDFSLITIFGALLLSAILFSPFIWFITGIWPLIIILILLSYLLWNTFQGEFILIAELRPNRELIIYDHDIKEGSTSLHLDHIKSVAVDSRSKYYTSKNGFELKAGRAVKNKAQVYICLHDHSIFIFGSQAYGGQLSQLKNFIYNELHNHSYPYFDPVLRKKGIEWLRLLKEFCEGQWQILLNNFLILISMTVLGWEFHNFVLIQFIDILILAFIAFFYNIVVSNKMSVAASFIFKSVSIFISSVAMIGAASVMVMMLEGVYEQIFGTQNEIDYSQYINMQLVLVGISFFMSRAYLFLKGFLQNNHHKQFDSVDLVRFFTGKIFAIAGWGIFAAALALLIRDCGSKSIVLFIVACVSVKTIVEMTHMFVLRKVSPKLVGILYPVRSL